jgi:transposase
MIGVDKIREIRKLGLVQFLPIREIVRRLNVSRNTVRKVLRSDITKSTYRRRPAREPITGSIREVVDQWIEEDEKLARRKRRTAWRIYELLQGQYGYSGSYESIAKLVRQSQERRIKEREVFIPLSYAPGEAFQFDWTDVQVLIGGKVTNLYLAVVTLCHSRHFYARAYESQKQELMLDAHRRAFEYFGGVCRRGIYDNLKTAVKKLLKGHHRNLQDKFVRFSSYYLYEPQFCNPARGNEKGRVESRIGYIKRNFFIPITETDSTEELNGRLLSFALATSRNKEHPNISGKTCYQVYEEERKSFVNLPAYGFECCRINAAAVSTYSTVFFEYNFYSVPSEYVGKTVFVRGYADELVVACDGTEIARHRRSYGRKEQILNPIHYLSVLLRKPGALRDGLPFKNWQLPEVFNIYRKMLNDKYEEADRYFIRTLLLLKEWPVKEVVMALNKAIDLGVLGDSYLVAILRHDSQPEMPGTPVEISRELARYQAKQAPIEQYDGLLTSKSK